MILALKREDYAHYFLFDKRLFFLVLCGINLLVGYVSSEFVLIKEVYYQTYGEQVAIERIDKYLELRESFSWIGYLFIPIILFVKMSYTAVCLNIGTVFAGLRIGFGKLFKIALIAESIFIIAAISRSGWLLFILDVSVLEDVQYFYPLSLLNLFEPGSLERWFIYPVHTLNLFELVYWLVLALGLSWVLKEGYDKMLRLVLSTYGIGLLIWMVFVVFLSLNLS